MEKYNETIKEHAERLLSYGKGALKRCKSSEGRKRITKSNRYFKEVIKLKVQEDGEES